MLTRSAIEVALLTQLIESTLQQQARHLARDGVCLRVVGNVAELPATLQATIAR